MLPASRCWASGPARTLYPARGRLVMLPKVETEALGLARSHGEQGQMPENMQGKEALAALGSRGSSAPGSPRGLQPPAPRGRLCGRRALVAAGLRGCGAARGRRAPSPGAGMKVYGS